MKKIVFLLVIVGLALGGIGYYFTQRDYRNDIKYTAADIEISAKALFAAFETDENQANTKYLGKILLVSGAISAIEQEDTKITIKLDTGDPLGAIVCEMNGKYQEDANSLETGQKISLQGECSGKLIDIILVNCIIKLK